MADLATLAPASSSGGRLGHFLPYLLRRRLRAVCAAVDVSAALPSVSPAERTLNVADGDAATST